MARGSTFSAERKRIPAGARRYRGAAKHWRTFIGGKVCAACRRAPATDPHHVIYAQHLKAHNLAGFLDDLDNCLPLCRGCHDAHHYPGVNARRITRDALRPENLAFARRVGLAWLLRREYPTDERRVA